MNIVNLVYKIQNSVFDIKNLNRGGCGVFAALVAKRLNRLGIPAVVRIGNWDASDRPNILEQALTNSNPVNMDNLRNWKVGFDHLIVEFTHEGKTYHMDSDHFHEAKERTTNFDTPIYRGHLTPKQALVIARSKRWNWTFNRKQIPAMIRALNKAIKIEV